MDEPKRKACALTLRDLTQLIDTVREGSTRAEEELFRYVRYRLEALIRSSLRSSPRIRRWQQTGDFLGLLWHKLHRILRSKPINDRRHFFRLANLSIRRILCDEARRCKGIRHQTGLSDTQAVEQVMSGSGESSASSADSSKREKAPTPTQFLGPLPPGASQALISKESHMFVHSMLHQLDEDEFELIGLIYYQEFSQVEAAEILGVDERTIRRRLFRIHRRLGQLADKPN